MLSCFSHVWLFVTFWTVSLQAPLSMGFSRWDYWSGLPFPSPGDLPDHEIRFGLLLGRRLLHCWTTWEAPVSSPGSVNQLSCIISSGLQTALWNKSYFPHFEDEETEMPQGKIPCQRSQWEETCNFLTQSQLLSSSFFWGIGMLGPWGLLLNDLCRYHCHRISSLLQLFLYHQCISRNFRKKAVIQ